MAKAMKAEGSALDQARDKVAHLEGCPRERVEVYEHTKPVKDRDTGDVRHRPVSVVRCVECGEHQVLTDRGALARAVRAEAGGTPSTESDEEASNDGTEDGN